MMMISRRANRYLHNSDPDVELIKKLNSILRLLEEYKAEYDIASLKTELVTARTGFLTACMNEMKEYFHGISEKNAARLEVEARISQFEEYIKSEMTELMLAYQQLRLSHN